MKERGYENVKFEDCHAQAVTETILEVVLGCSQEFLDVSGSN